MVGRNKSGIVLNQSQEKFQAFKGNHYPGLEKFFFVSNILIPILVVCVSVTNT